MPSILPAEGFKNCLPQTPFPPQRRGGDFYQLVARRAGPRRQRGADGRSLSDDHFLVFQDKGLGFFRSKSWSLMLRCIDFNDLLGLFWR